MNMIVIKKDKPIISKTILKKPRVGDKEKVKTETLEIDINLRQGSSIYRYNIIDNFKQILANIFFEDLVKIEQYREKLRQYINSIDKRKANKVKSIIIEKKTNIQILYKTRQTSTIGIIEYRSINTVQQCIRYPGYLIIFLI